MEKSRIILSDVDGVLCNWNIGFQNFMLGRGYPQLPDTDGLYDIAGRHGITHDEAMGHIREFNESDRISHLSALADSEEYIRKLSGLGFRFTVVTSLSSAPDAKIYRSDNLTKIFGDVFREIVCLSQGANKYNELTRWKDSGLFWIEDHPEQAEAGLRAGLKPVLISHPYNSHYMSDKFPFVTSENPWKEIFKLICKEYEL